MTPTPRTDTTGVPWCSPDCPAYAARRCEIDQQRVEDGAVCLPRVREMARMIEAAAVAAEDDSVREARRRMGR